MAEQVYKVEDSYDGWKTVNSFALLNASEVRKLAEYYYHNSDETAEIDFSNIDNCIDFIRRVDKVDGITHNMPRQGVEV